MSRAISQLRKRDRAHANLRRPVREQALGDAAGSAKREAHRVGVEHVFERHSNGSFSLVRALCFGLSIASDQAPRQARKLAGHSSSGSRITRRPSRRTTTSLSPLGKR